MRRCRDDGRRQYGRVHGGVTSRASGSRERFVPTRHKVRQGEDVSSIAAAYGVPVKKVADHPGNASLKSERKGLHILRPGDVIVVPDREDREETAGTGQKARFRKKSDKTTLRLKLLDDDFQPRANVKYKLVVGGKTSEGATDGSGMLKEPVPPGAERGHLILDGKDVLPLSFAALDPADSPSGVRQRLSNLGFAAGEGDGPMDGKTRGALRRFQKAHGLNETGEADAATKAKLEEVHGT